jgi:hypothetical protein
VPLGQCPIFGLKLLRFVATASEIEGFSYGSLLQFVQVLPLGFQARSQQVMGDGVYQVLLSGSACLNGQQTEQFLDLIYGVEVQTFLDSFEVRGGGGCHGPGGLTVGEIAFGLLRESSMLETALGLGNGLPSFCPQDTAMMGNQILLLF